MPLVKSTLGPLKKLSGSVFGPLCFKDFGRGLVKIYMNPGKDLRSSIVSSVKKCVYSSIVADSSIDHTNAVWLAIYYPIDEFCVGTRDIILFPIRYRFRRESVYFSQI